MSYDTYWMIHIGAIVALFLALGAALMGPPKGEKGPKSASILHGLALLVILVAGMGLIARRELQQSEFPWWPGWVFAKLGVWLLLGLLPLFVRKGWVPRPIGWVVALGLGVAAAWLVLTRPWA